MSHHRILATTLSSCLLSSVLLVTGGSASAHDG